MSTSRFFLRSRFLEAMGTAELHSGAGSSRIQRRGSGLPNCRICT